MAFSDPVKNIKELNLHDGMEVADFGAGAGYYALAAVDIVGESGNVYLIDIQQELLTKSKSQANETQLKSLHFICGDLEEIGGTHLKDGLVDAVIVSNVLFQIEDREQCLKEAWRILKPHGQLLLVDWSDSYGGIGPQPEYVLKKEEVERLAKAVGFTLDHEFDAGGYHYGMVLKK